MFRMASCAAKCVRHLPDHRPRMSQVMDALTGKINLDNWNNGSTQVDNQDLNKFWKQSLGKINLDNWNNESTKVDNQDLNKFWKQSLGEYKEPITSSLENTTEASSYSASG
ncbi:hypothetical protein QN277_010974 [Acacia crassicarpa]|uniref:Uncharacterized protein n=1 Tax=Acacia crassicarpa TaxID=499986 RepID=A0AAE1IN41_9FABA|nr:hypothetical protein QN277_010974 [Acacia crassicarpa]